MKLISRREAKEQSLKYYYTGKPCKHGHDSKRIVRSARCYQCTTIYTRSYQRSQHSKARAAEYYKNNKEYFRNATKRHNDKHPETRAAARAKRRAAKKYRTVRWANHDYILSLYKQAIRLSECTGIKFHVDHVIPIHPALVSGLHVETNLSVIPASINLAKQNAFDI